MGNLLEMVSHKQLCEGIPLDEVRKACSLLADYMESEMVLHGGLNTKWIAAVAYVMGTRQGVHQERQKRATKKTHQPTNTRKEELAQLAELLEQGRAAV